MSAAAKPLLVTAGDPAGIGPELCLGIADEAQKHPFVVITDAEMLRERAALLGLDVRVREVDINGAPEHGEREILVHHLPFAVSVACGKPDPANAAALIEGLRLAATACQDGTAGALVTAPLAKSVICDSGVPFSGHTEFLAELTGAALPVMLLAAGDLRVALASTHLPLRDVPDFITSERLHAVLDVLHSDLRAKFAIDDPDIVVCGLNPHAGESGHLGHEDA
ncbi:MAG: 4-hydroxythreonine-4-phosphate dehydrogenase PdxA, partial [Woeseiaceae bacterium]|nr:4-hydroxythreonine-4-phosphate dehydrogenase PdxA [Woeseiaceae bacterium]